MDSKGKEVNLEVIEKKLPEVAFKLFRFWTGEYGIADEITIKTEQALVFDLRNTFVKALVALYKEQNLNHKPTGWDVGFVIGFVEGNLGKHWH